MEIKRPDVSHLPFEVPENLEPAAYLLLGDEEKKSFSLINRFWLPGVTAITPGLTALFMRHVWKRPIYACMFQNIVIVICIIINPNVFLAMHRVVGVMVAGGLLGEWAYHHVHRHYAERDLQYFHYICLHPEDFKAPGKILFQEF